MVIDIILDRYEGDAYEPKEFYEKVTYYENEDIASALDGGSDEDIKRELCNYIDDCYYNPNIKNFINSVSWLSADDGRNYRELIKIN